ncbi:MAG: uroporphyrinogen decarboxylase family protein [Verrucomicrobiota bacterium]
MKMTSLERVRNAAVRKKTDRPCTGLRCTPEAWEKLREYFSVQTDNEVLDLLDIDLRWVAPTFTGPKEKSAIPLWSEGYDFWGCHTKAAKNEFNTYYEFDFHPLAEAESVEEVHAHDWPSLDWWDFSSIVEQSEAHDAKERRAHMFFCGGTFETPWYIRGMETFFMDLYENPDIVTAICTHVGDYYQARAMMAIERTGGCIDMIGSGGDIGGQHGMMIDPELWRELIKPHSRRLIEPFREKGLMTFYHSCGSLVPTIDDLIEMGLQFLDPIQVTATGMEPENIFKLFGDRLSFHGAVDEVELLPHATPGEVYDETIRLIDILGANSGFIVAPSHMVQGDTAPENIEVIYKAVKDYPNR